MTFAPAWVGAEHVKLFVLTGQSNSLGTTNGGEADFSPGADPADEKIRFYWHNLVDATINLGTSGGEFTNLQAQQGGFYAGSASHWGPEMSFGRTLYRAGVRNFGIIKASRGGGGNSLWLKGSVDDHMYDHVVTTVSEATAKLSNEGHTFELVGLLYLQGESDDSSEASAAGARLKTLTDNLREDLPNAAAMRTVIAGTTAAGNADDRTTREEHARIAANTSYIEFFDNLDQQSNLAPDGVHLNRAGKELVGTRFALSFLNSGVVSRHYGKLVFIGDSITQGGNGRPSYRYQVFKNLAQAGVLQDAASGYEFVGSLRGAYQSNAGATPDLAGQGFVNRHEGHWGWRAMWISGRVALPLNRRGSNRGEGTLENWLGLADPQQYLSDGGVVAFPDPAASGTGITSPYQPYTPDTACVMIGINESTTNPPSQVRDDIGMIIDQLRAANPAVRIHLNQLLYSDNVPTANVDAINALLPQLVADKNAASNLSPVWLVEANEGFVASTMTYDNTHPNADGEIQVGDIISESLGLIESFDGGNGDEVPALLEERAGEDLGGLKFRGDEIFNTGSFVNRWQVSGDIAATPADDGGLGLVHAGGAAAVLDGSHTGWADLNDGVWTLTVRLKFDPAAGRNENGFILWMGTGAHRILVEVLADGTRDFGADSFQVSHNNRDGHYHTFQIRHDPAAQVYHVWRDGVALTATAGAPYDQAGADERLLLGDYTNAAFGDAFAVTVDSIKICRGYEGNEISNGSASINGWERVGSVSEVLEGDSDLRISNGSGGASWLDGSGTSWSVENDGDWTFETRLKFNANPSGFILWLGTGTQRILVEIYADRTQDTGQQSFNAAHNNADGEFHQFRIAHDSVLGVYHVWRDGVRLTALEGAVYDATADDERMILGDFTSGAFGNGFDVTIDYIRWDDGKGYLPPGADVDVDGLPDIWEMANFGDLISAQANGDADGDGVANLEEFQVDTNPNSASSAFKIRAFLGGVGEPLLIEALSTSPNRRYFVLESDDLGIADAWGPVAGLIPRLGNGGTLQFQLSPLADRFYRVQVSAR